MNRDPLETLDEELNASLAKAETAETEISQAALQIGDAAEAGDWESLLAATIELSDAENLFWETEN